MAGQIVRIGAAEAKDKFGMLLDRVEHGEEIIITRHGIPVARLVPNAMRVDKQQAYAALERMRTRAEKLKQPFDWGDAKAEREAGRP